MEQVDANNFDSVVLKSDTPVVVDFWAQWCGPCKALAPVLEDVAKEMGPKAKIVKLNVDDNHDLSAQYGIRGIPTLIFFKDGQAKKTLVGNQPRQEILQSIKDLCD